MIVGDLLRLEDLRIEVAWATPELLAREVTGVTSTDLQDPARYLRQGELVLTGLVWWRPDDLAADPVAAAQAAGRFATALRSAEAAALLAGEGTHGTVPAELADACRRHGIPLLTVPAGTSFRAVTDRVYLRLWGDLQHQAEGTAALPAAVSRELLALLHAGAEPSTVLARAVSDLGLPHCSLRTTAGRLLGSSDPAGRPPGDADRTGGMLGSDDTAGRRLGVPDAAGRKPGGSDPAEWAPGRAVPAGRPHGNSETAGRARPPRPRTAVPRTSTPGTASTRTAARWALPVGRPGVTPFDGWLLVPHAEPGPAAAAVLRGLAELLAPLAARNRSTAAAQRQGGTRVVDLLRASAAPGPGRDGAGSAAELGEALRSCGLPEQAAMTPVVARASGGPASWAAAALAEALQGTGAPFVVAPDPDRSAAEPGGATGLCAAPEAEVLAALERAWPRLRAVLAAPVPPRTEPRETEHGDQAERPELSAAVGPDVAPTLPTLRAALAQAEWILAAGPGPGPGATGTAGPAGGVAGSGSLGSLAALLRGVPAEVRAAYRERLLGPLLAHDRVNSVSLLHTLAVFLDLDGSWSRAAQALHVHVNTVHYRVRRIEELTGRNLSRLEDRTDLRAALLCESAPS